MRNVGHLQRRNQRRTIWLLWHSGGLCGDPVTEVSRNEIEAGEATG